MCSNEKIFSGVFDNLKQHCLLIPPVNLNKTLLQNLNESFFPKIKNALFISTTNERHAKIAWHALKWRLGQDAKCDLMANKEKCSLDENHFSNIFRFNGVFDPKGKDINLVEAIRSKKYDAIFFTCNEMLGQSYFSWIDKPILNYENISDLVSMLLDACFVGIDNNFMIWLVMGRRLPFLFDDCLPNIDFSRVLPLLYPDEIDKLFTISKNLKKDATIVEIGAYEGGSSVILALALKERNDNEGVIYSIDPGFQPNFYKNIEHHNVKDIVVPIKMESTEAAKKWLNNDFNQKSKNIDLLFIDGAHFYDDVRQDLLSWVDFLAPGGIIAIHDYASRREGYFLDVVRATYELLVMNDNYEVIELVESLLIIRKL